jgi:hypothetical protein
LIRPPWEWIRRRVGLSPEANSAVNDQPNRCIRMGPRKRPLFGYRASGGCAAPQSVPAWLESSDSATYTGPARPSAPQACTRSAAGRAAPARPGRCSGLTRTARAHRWPIQMNGPSACSTTVVHRKFLRCPSSAPRRRRLPGTTKAKPCIPARREPSAAGCRASVEPVLTGARVRAGCGSHRAPPGLALRPEAGPAQAPATNERTLTVNRRL